MDAKESREQIQRLQQSLKEGEKKLRKIEIRIEDLEALAGQRRSHPTRLKSDRRRV